MTEEIDEKILCKLRLTNPSNNLAFFINPSIRKGREGEGVLPTFWSDNYFSILPGKTRELSIEFHKSELGRVAPYLELDGWNIAHQLIRIN